ncbi:MAG: iron-containing alcohol dehydrogenase [Promethearchaeota archaeon]
MDKKREQLAFYEMDIVKDMMGLMGGRALRGIMSNFFTSRIYSGKVGLFLVKNYLEATIKEGERRALIITDAFTERFAGNVTKYLDLMQMDYKIWSGAEPEAPLNTIDEGVKICEEFKPKVLIAIGGGSVMDTAKIILIKYEKPEENLYMILPYVSSLGLRKKIKYFIAIPTTSGTGSEVTGAAVATDLERTPPKKLEIMSDEIIPDIAILDTDFVKDMPPFLTMATGLDVFAHSMGSYVSNWGSPFIDAINITSIKEVLKYLPRAYKYGAKDLEARQHMQMAALIAGLGFGNTTAGIDHSLGHSFGKVFNVHHGLSVGLFTPYSIAFQSKVTERWKDLCPIFSVEIKDKSKNELLKELIQSIKDFMRSIDGPTCIMELKNPLINKEEYVDKLDLMAKYADKDGVSLLSYRSINEQLYKRIFEYAWDGKDIDF